MDLTNAIKTSCVDLNISLKKKDDVLKEIAKMVKTTTEAENCSEKQIYKELKKREKLASTGFGNGIAIPHCVLDEMKDFVIGVITFTDGVDFDSIDNSKVNILVFIVGTSSRRNEHIRYLSALSSILREENNREKILEASTADEVKNILIGQSETKEQTNESREYNQFHITVQKSDLFDEILEIFTEVEESYLTILESNNASHYLYSKPLFASLWESEEKSFSRLIIAIIKKNVSNEVIRKINMKLKDSNGEGLIFSVQDIIYFNGNIDI